MVGAPFLSLLLVVVASFPRLLLDAVALSLFYCVLRWPHSLSTASSYYYCYPPSSHLLHTASYTAMLDYMKENANEKENEQEKDNNDNGVTLHEWADTGCFLHVVVATLVLASGLWR